MNNAYNLNRSVGGSCAIPSYSLSYYRTLSVIFLIVISASILLFFSAVKLVYSGVKKESQFDHMEDKLSSLELAYDKELNELNNNSSTTLSEYNNYIMTQNNKLMTLNNVAALHAHILEVFNVLEDLLPSTLALDSFQYDYNKGNVILTLATAENSDVKLFLGELEKAVVIKSANIVKREQLSGSILNYVVELKI